MARTPRAQIAAQIGALGLASALLSAPLTARAAEVVVSKSADKVAVTVYRNGPASAWSLMHRPAWMSPGGLVLVVETRTVRLPAGASVIRFEGVSDQIVPQTTEIEGLPARTFERNFDYDLLSPGSLIAKSLGREVELVDTNHRTGKAVARRAVLRSGPDGVMLEVDGKVEAFKCDSVPERMVFDRIPDGLSDRPTLSVKVDAPKAGRVKVRLSYLATGVSWASDYVARVRPDGRTLDLEGWITLANDSAASFRDAPTQVVAGRLALTGDDRAVEIAPIVRREQCWNRKPAWSRPPPPLVVHEPPPPPVDVPAPPPAPMSVREVVVTGSRVPIARQQDLGDYKLYTLPFPTTVAARQTKQVLFLSKTAVPFERVYRYAVAPLDQDLGPHKTAVVLKLKNTKAGGLGLPLPQGTVSIREPDAAGELLFTGEAKLDDTPKGLPVKLETGHASAVLATQRVVSREDLGRGPAGGRQRRVRVRYEISVVNGGPKPAAVEVVHPWEGQGFAVTADSPSHGTDGGSPVWTLTVPAGGREVLSYGVEAERWAPR